MMITTQPQEDVQCSFSQTIGELTKALQNFQRACPKIPKSSRGQFGRFADLPTIHECIKQPLLDAELTVIQMPVGEHGLTTMLSHSSGEWICSTYHMQPLEAIIDKTTKEKAITPQSLGSVISYQRRYAIGAILNLNIDHDDDAASNSSPTGSEPEQPATKKPTAKELMEQAKAKANAESTPAATVEPVEPVATVQAEVIPPTANTNTTTMLMASEEGKLSEPMDSKCSEQLSMEIKKELGTWEQSHPGISGKFTQQLFAAGFKKLTDLTTAQAQNILTQVSTRNTADFFQQSLEKATA